MYIFDLENESTCLCSPNTSKYAKSDRNFFDLRIRWPKSSGVGPKSGDLGHQIFESKNGMVSKFKMLSTTASSSRAIDELDGDTAGWRSWVAPDAQSAGGASLRGQTGAGSGLDIKRSALGAHLSVDMYSSRLKQQQQSVALCHNKNYQDRLTLEHPTRLFAARPEAVSVSSYSWIPRAVQRLSASLCGARPQQQSVSAFVRILARTIYLFFSQRKTASKWPSSHVKKIRSGQNLKLQNRTA